MISLSIVYCLLSTNLFFSSHLFIKKKKKKANEKKTQNEEGGGGARGRKKEKRGVFFHIPAAKPMVAVISEEKEEKEPKEEKDNPEQKVGDTQTLQPATNSPSAEEASATNQDDAPQKTTDGDIPASNDNPLLAVDDNKVLEPEAQGAQLMVGTDIAMIKTESDRASALGDDEFIDLLEVTTFHDKIMEEVTEKTHWIERGRHQDEKEFKEIMISKDTHKAFKKLVQKANITDNT
ncbi:hypothetical protein RFI_20170, partial [Reticulomyxa filosa]